MTMAAVVNHHLVKNEDLNNRGTLYAGRAADWCVESGFLAASLLAQSGNFACLKIHDLIFRHPVGGGEILAIESRAVLAGRTKLVVHVQASVGARPALSGFLTFVRTDAEGRPFPHGIVIEPATPEEADLHDKAKNLPV